MTTLELKGTQTAQEINLRQIMLPGGAANVGGTPLVMLPGNVLKVDISALAVADDIVAVQNPFRQAVIIREAYIQIVTDGGTASAVIDVDVVDGPTDTGNDIFDGIDADAIALTGSDDAAAGDDAEHAQWLWGAAGSSTDHVTAKLLVEAAADLVAYLYLDIVPTE